MYKFLLIFIILTLFLINIDFSYDYFVDLGTDITSSNLLDSNGSAVSQTSIYATRKLWSVIFWIIVYFVMLKLFYFTDNKVIKFLKKFFESDFILFFIITGLFLIFFCVFRVGIVVLNIDYNLFE